MKVTIPVVCSSCKTEFPHVGYAGRKFPVAVCPTCGESIHIIEHLSISVDADLLLHRSKSEMEGGDFTLSIILNAIAVECGLTQVFLKWKAIASERSVHTATDVERDAWEKVFLNSTNWGKFKSSANFVSKFLTGMDFDDFVQDFHNKTKDHVGLWIKAGFPSDLSMAKVDRFQKEIFNTRNRVMHWGKVDYEHSDAARSLDAAIVMINILKRMDRQRCEKMESDWRQANA
jgi:hypothetical protein